MSENVNENVGDENNEDDTVEVDVFEGEPDKVDRTDADGKQDDDNDPEDPEYTEEKDSEDDPNDPVVEGKHVAEPPALDLGPDGGKATDA